MHRAPPWQPPGRSAQRGSEHAKHLGYSLRSLPELVEAGTRCGQLDLAVSAVHQLSQTTSASGTDWGLGMEVRARAVISTGATAENLWPVN
jgi:hypothetical protein